MIKNKEQKQQVQLNDYKPGDDQAIFKILSSAFPDTWNNIDIWRWKHSNRPNFDSKGILTADDGSSMVGCFHGAVFSLKLEPGIVVNTSFDGDFAVSPEYRGQKIPTRVHDIMDLRLKDAGVALRGGFTSQGLNERFYHKQFGYVFIPTVSTNFRKVIGIKSLRKKIEVLGQELLDKAAIKDALVISPLTINFNVDGFPPFHLLLSSQAFYLNDKFSEHADISITAPYKVIMNLSIGIKQFILSGISNFLMGRIKIRGLFKSKKKLFSILRSIVKQTVSA